MTSSTFTSTFGRPSVRPRNRAVSSPAFVRSEIRHRSGSAIAGLRISDVITLSREHIQGAYLVKRAVKNGNQIRVELPGFVLQALAMTPLAKAAPRDCPFYFGGGESSLRSLLSGAERTLRAVFRVSGVEKAHAHRFRHTLASELIAKGESIEMVAEILADSPAIIRKHYAKWTPDLQRRRDAATRKISGTNPAQADEPTKTLLT